MQLHHVLMAMERVQRGQFGLFNSPSLARNGPDLVSNVLALCPNCHRMAHRV